MLEKSPDTKLKFEEKDVEVFKTTYDLTEHIYKDNKENIGYFALALFSIKYWRVTPLTWHTTLK